MSHYKLRVALFALWVISAEADAQQVIPFAHDTVHLYQRDSLISRTGDALQGEVRSISEWGHRTICTIQDGYVTSRRGYFPNGQDHDEYNYKRRQRHGSHRQWSDKGVLLVEGYYTSDMEDSVWTYYRSDGTMESQGRFLADPNYRLTDFKIYHHYANEETGDLETIVQIAAYHSAPNGEWIYFDRNGAPMKWVYYDKGCIKQFHVGDSTEWDWKW